MFLLYIYITVTKFWEIAKKYLKMGWSENNKDSLPVISV